MCQIVLVPPAVNSCRPVQIKIAVDDAGEAVTFYSDAFGIRYDVIRRTEKGDVSSLVFGKPGHDDFFLLVLIARGDDVGDRPSGTSTIGLLVDELDAAHTYAVAAGGTELVAPHDPRACLVARRWLIRAATASGCTRRNQPAPKATEPRRAARSVAVPAADEASRRVGSLLL